MVCEFVEHLERAVDGVIVELKKKKLGVKRARSSIPGLFLRKEKVETDGSRRVILPETTTLRYRGLDWPRVPQIVAFPGSS